MNNNFELDSMRQQMDTLKKKLDEQEIVNDKLIHNSMRRNAHFISLRYYITIVIGLLMIPYSYWCFIKTIGLSQAFWIGTSVFMLICVVATYYNCRNLNNFDLTKSNLLNVSKRMARAKKFDSNWLFFGIPAVILWFAWLVYEVYQISTASTILLIAGFIGVIIGAIIGFSLYFKTQRKYQEIIDQIEDLTAED